MNAIEIYLLIWIIFTSIFILLFIGIKLNKYLQQELNDICSLFNQLTK
jgi:hypothetical protein